MREFIYEVCKGKDERVETFVKLIQKLNNGWHLRLGEYLKVYDALNPKKLVATLVTMGDINDFITQEEQIKSRKLEADWENEPKKEWKPFNELEELSNKEIIKDIVKDAINPSHYQEFFKIGEQALQWLEAKQHEGQFKDPVKFKAAISLQIEKYLDRNGGKDSEEQELSKALWYMKFLVAYVKNGNKPILVSQIDDILKGK